MTSPIFVPGQNSRGNVLRFDQMNDAMKIKWLKQELENHVAAINEARGRIVLMSQAQNEMLHLLTALVDTVRMATMTGSPDESLETRRLAWEDRLGQLAGRHCRAAEDALLKKREGLTPDQALDERIAESTSIRMLNLVKRFTPPHVEKPI